MMSNYVAGKVLPGISALLAVSLAACVGSASNGETALEGFPVQWTDEFSMPGLIDEPTSVSSQEDLRSLLGRDWYAGIDVIRGEAKSADTLTSCDDYFSVKGEPLRVYNEQENSAFLELVVMCEATRLFVEATSSRRSAVPSQPLAERLPDNLPKSMALITSESEAQRIMSNPTINSWGEVNEIRKMERVSEHRVVYHLDSGQQSLSILGRGDFNDDGNEDLLVSVQSTVDGGSYFDLRLFALTVTESGEWVVDAHYPSP